jgi:hypothetical protein
MTGGRAAGGGGNEAGGRMKAKRKRTPQEIPCTLHTFPLDFRVSEMYPLLGAAISTGTELLLEMGCECQGS